MSTDDTIRRLAAFLAKQNAAALTSTATTLSAEATREAERTAGALLSSATPQPLGTAAPGTSGKASDAGHMHAMPSDIVTVGAIATGSWHGTVINTAHGGTGATSFPAFSVHKNGTAQTGVGTSTFTRVTWSTEDFDTASCFASNAFTPNSAGYYWLGAVVEFDTGLLVDQCRAILYLYKNGTFVKAMESPMSGTGYLSLSVSAVLQANGTTDYFEVYVWHNAGVNQTLLGFKLDTYWTGYRIIA